jgi:prephenate dehydrogenase
VTDVGSTKRDIVRAAERLAEALPLAFVGSHPMAGSDRSGYDVARGDLFQGACVIVTPTDATDPRAVKRVTEFWGAVGARVSTLDPQTHDRVVAAISHLPHLVAYALVDAVARFEPGALEFAARGFKDTTRIAASDERVWREIFFANREALAGTVAGFRRALAELEAGLAAGDAGGLEVALARIRRDREALR